MHKRVLIPIISFILINPGFSQEQIPNTISVYELGNGLKVLLIENRALPMVGVNVVVKTGSAYETFSTSGMSHMLEHLLFNGTTSRTQKQLYDDTDRIGGYNNAHTGEYGTNYMMVTPAEHILKGMEIQADMLFNSIIPEEKFKKEIGIVLEEIAQSLGQPAGQVERNVNSLLFQGHALALPTLGTYSTIESLSRDVVNDYYRGTYVPNNMILNAVGNFSADSMLKEIQKIYGKYPAGSVYRPQDANLATGFGSLPVTGVTPDHIFHRYHSGNSPLLHLAFKLLDNEIPEFFELLDNSLSRITPDLEDVLKSQFPGLIKSVNHSLHLTPVANFLIVKVTLEQEQQISKIIDLLSKKIQTSRLALPHESVETIITQNRSGFLKSLEKPHMFGIYNAEIFATSSIDAALASLNSNNFLLAEKNLKQFRIQAKPLIIFHHSTKKSEAETTQEIQEKLFSESNTEFTLIAKQNSGNQIFAVHYLLKHKAYYQSIYGEDAAKILHDCFGQRMKSTKNQAISSRFGLTFTVNDNPYIPMDNIYLHPDFGYIRVEGLADDLPAVIQFLNKQMSQFVPTKTEFQKALASFNRGVHAMGRNEARDLFEETYRSIVYEPEKYPADSTELTYDNLVAFSKVYFRPSNWIISTVTPATPDSVFQLFNSMKVKKQGDLKTEPEVYDEALRQPGKKQNIEKDGGGEQSYLFWGFVKEIYEEDQPALQALSLILADKIIFDVREKQGMAYRMRAGIEIRHNRALFSINMGTRPANVDILLPQFPDFFSPKMIGSVNKSELEKSLNMYLGRMMFRRLSSINQAYYLGTSWYFHDDINHDRNFLEQLKQVSLNDVKQVANKYLKVDSPISVVVR